MPSNPRSRVDFEHNCHHCDAPIIGRADKKFCDVYCRVAFHRAVKKTRYQSFYHKVKASLNLNRRILMMFNFEGTTTVEAGMVLDKGFNTEYFTHLYTNTQNITYRFVFETGFRTFTKGKINYIQLIKWQPYMSEDLDYEMYSL